MDYLFYPGCALESSSNHYGRSAEATMAALGHRLVELEGWNCCGATAYVGTDENKALAYSARNLALAESKGCDDLVTACSGCYLMLHKTEKRLTESPEERERVARALAAVGLNLNGSVKVRHLVNVLLEDVGPDAIASRVKASLSGLRIAPYHGCQIGRPYGTELESERPDMLDRLLAPTEADIVPFPHTASCCGGMLMTTRREVGLGMTETILSCARDLGADCLAVACPLCLVNLECYQDRLCKRDGYDAPLPVLLFTQLMGLALGAPVDELGLECCYIEARPLLAAYV